VQAQYDSIYFPLNIGNKFFYQGGRDPDDGFYGSIKEIIDTLSDGTRIVSVTNYFISSTSSVTEYWQLSDKKLFAGSYLPMSIPVFNGYYTEDTCIVPGLNSQCYYLFNKVLFNQNQYCELYSDRYFHMGTSVIRNTFTANNVGIYFKSTDAVSYGYSSKDSIQLIGFTNNGILIGDSIITEIFDPNPIIYSCCLNQNYPNPFNPITTITYQIPERGFVTLKVYDILGREVATLVNEEKTAGSYEVQFNSHSGNVRNLTSGIYFYQLKVGVYEETKKMILLK
jgi:hypothetical protein